jgi:hypothetical protein
VVEALERGLHLRVDDANAAAAASGETSDAGADSIDVTE